MKEELGVGAGEKRLRVCADFGLCLSLYGWLAPCTPYNLSLVHFTSGASSFLAITSAFLFNSHHSTHIMRMMLVITFYCAQSCLHVVLVVVGIF